MENETKQVRPPKEKSGGCYSNCDHQYEEGAEDKLRAGEVLQHSAWDFCGTVWFADNQFHEEVWQYHSIIKVVSDDTLQEVIAATNEEFGYE